MAKKNKSFSVVCAFWGLLIASSVFVVSGIFRAFGILSSIVSILDLAGKIALFLAVALTAYEFVKDKKTGWKVTYWIVVIVYATGVIFGIVKF